MGPSLVLLVGLNLLSAASSLAADALSPARGWVFEDRGGGLVLWLDGQRFGIVLMTDPANFRPAWWHNRDYGLMVANSFGQEAMKQGAKAA